jgi:hypothetical protein
MAPTPQSVKDVKINQQFLKKLEDNWIKIKTVEVKDLNKKLKQAGQRPLEI